MTNKSTSGTASPGALATLLVKWRMVLLVLMVSLAAVCGVLIPRTRINSDITSNLPDSSPMRHGLELLADHFPMMDIRMQTLRVMFLNEAPADSLKQAILAVPGVQMLTGVERRDTLTLYQFIMPQDADGAAVERAVSGRFGSRAVVEVDNNINLPENMFLMLGAGVAIGFLILFLMCPSFLEAILILFSIGVAVLINMGTNSLLPSVYLVTHTLVAVLQMVLSMDFSIILMNRYRQEKIPGRSNAEAMAWAITHASPSILSSGLTTIASMMMLCFIRLKIGADLGIVLSKGVLCSLVTTFTVLPAIIILCDRGITKTEKKMLRLPTDGLAKFEMKFRWPLSLLFIALVAASFFLQRRTVISYEIEFPTKITRIFPPKQPVLLMYPTAGEEAFLPVAEKIAAYPGVTSCLSYPGIALKERSASELMELSALGESFGGEGFDGSIANDLPEDAIGLLYYAASHRERDERMRLDELEPTARELLALAEGLMSEEQLAGFRNRLDMNGIMTRLEAQLMAEVSEDAQELSDAQEADSSPSGDAPLEALADPDGASSGTPAAPGDASSITTTDTSVVRATPELLPFDSSKAGVTGMPSDLSDTAALRLFMNREEINRQRSVSEISSALGIDASQIGMVFRIAGRKGPSATMSAYEFLVTLNEKVLSRKMYASMMTQEQRDGIRLALDECERILAEPEVAVAQAVDTVVAPEVRIAGLEPETAPEVVSPDTDITGVAPDKGGILEAGSAPDVPVIPVEPTPAEQLLEMAFSGRKYSSSQVCRALNRAGIKVDQGELDLLYMYHGFKAMPDTSMRLSLRQISGFLDSLEVFPQAAQMLKPVEDQLGTLRSPEWSLAVIVCDLPPEGKEMFDLLDMAERECRERLDAPTYMAGYSVMYKEMKEGFPRELLLLTLLTVAAIFLIVALTFRSLAVPFMLIPTVLAAVWLNVFASGLGGRTLFYLAYLIVQSILMGATIDYSILFTQYYREARLTLGKGEALKVSYRKSFHAILTSGLIITLTPLLMVYTISDPMVISVLRCISAGAMAAILLILLALPALIALLDRFICRRSTD